MPSKGQAEGTAGVRAGDRLTALSCRAPRLVKPAISRLQLACRCVALAVRVRGGAGKLGILSVGLAKLPLEMLDPPPQELLLLGGASKLPLRSLERASSSVHLGCGCLHSFRSAARRVDGRIRLGKSTL
jgi:hypothetical protein